MVNWTSTVWASSLSRVETRVDMKDTRGRVVKVVQTSCVLVGRNTNIQHKSIRTLTNRWSFSVHLHFYRQQILASIINIIHDQEMNKEQLTSLSLRPKNWVYTNKTYCLGRSSPASLVKSFLVTRIGTGLYFRSKIFSVKIFQLQWPLARTKRSTFRQIK